MNKRPVEKLSRALRRRAQILDWQRSQKTEGLDPSPSGAGGSDVAHAGNASRSKGVANEAPHFTATPAQSTNCEEAVIHANYSLRRALVCGAPETRATRQVRDAIRHSAGKGEALGAFQSLLLADGESPTAATYKALSSALLQHHVQQQVGQAAFQKALMEAAGTESDRWKRLSEEERSVFVNYLCRMTQRWAERGSSYNELLGFSQEGADNKVVTQVEYQMRKGGVMVSAASLADLMHLDIAWSTALHLYKYAQELYKVLPPVEMSDRLMGLMTGYRTGLGGSRPWLRALEVYQKVLASGYKTTLTTHAHALDALWRSADTFHRTQCLLSSSHQQLIWRKAIEIAQCVQDTPQLLITGEEGCAYAESLVKVVAASSRWSTAVSLLANLDTSTANVSFRFLVPTAETYAFVMAACSAAGHAAHVGALWTIFRDTYTLRSLHSEVLLILLQSFRNVVRTLPIVGSLIEELVGDSKGLERPVAVACLQLLSSRYVTTRQRRWELASRVLDMYDANPWPQQPLARKAELQTVFRCCHLISAMEAPDGKRLLEDLRGRLIAIFGNSSAEVEWLDDTSIYALQTVTSWREAISIYDTAVGKRGPEKVPFLPVPLRQARTMLLEALLRCCRAMEADDEFFLVDEDTQEADRHAAAALAERSLAVARAVHTTDDTFPHHVYAELLLLRSLGVDVSSQRKAHALEAMRHFSRASAGAIEHRHVAGIATALSLTEVHVENALLRGHAALRYATLSLRNDKKKAKHVHEVFVATTW